MKQRFSSLDVKVIAHELSNTLTTLRVANIYDLSSKIFLVKFAKPDNKQQIVIDSGFRCHLTEYARTTAGEPSDFVRRLRKFLKTRRVTSVLQVGTDRIIEFQFSDGQYRLFLEFYASGNVILTDKELNILVLQRIVHEAEGQEELRVGLKYSLDNRQNYGGVPELTIERLRAALQTAVDRGDDKAAVRKGAKKSGDLLRRALAVSITEYPPMLVDHAMRVTKFDSSIKPAEVLQSEVLLDALMQSLHEAKRVVHEITSSDISTGYIIAKEKVGYNGVPNKENTKKGLIYDDFHPFRPRQFDSGDATVFLQFEGFNKTVDEFFSSIEGQKLESRLQERKLNAQKKIKAARQDQAQRLGGLQELQSMNERKASAIQANVERVQEAIDAVNSLIAQGMDWAEIGKLIEAEQKRSNPVASMIKLPLKLQENTITLLLGEEDLIDEDSAYETDSDASDSESEGARKPETKQSKIEQRLAIDINLGSSPWSNARDYHSQRRYAATKEQKTLESSTKALKSQEAKITQDLKKGLKQEKAILRPVRQLMWFEKFTWFVSSDGYLVLSGKDAQQHEILYKNYLKKGDIYLHADIEGAPPVVIRNSSKDPDAPIPPSTLSQAGNLVVACSSAWDSKAGMSAWWVNAHQVSKAASGGEFLPTGKFSINGQKNFLPPAQLLLGFGVIFQISESSKANHVKHRVEVEPNRDLTPKILFPAESSSGHIEPIAGAASPNDEYPGATSDDQESDTEGQYTTPNPLQNQPEDLPHVRAGHGPHLTQEIAGLQIDEHPRFAEHIQRGDGSTEHDDEAEAKSSTGAQTPSQQEGATGGAPIKRGKRGKAKKIAAKYKDQDEEDRIAAQHLIGASAGIDKARAEAGAKAKREAEIAFQKERRRAQHQRTQQETAAHEELRNAILTDGVGDFDGQEEKVAALDTLVGTPLRGDEIMEAIPICAPWAALSRFKYKAKLQPGAQKKGKAVKEIVARWMADATSKGKVDEHSEDAERMWPREVDLIRGWKAEEITNSIPVSKVKVMMAGGSTIGQSKGAQGKPKGGSNKGSKKAR